MITIICTLFKGARLGIPHSTEIYNAEWADKLYRGLKRNITTDFELVCLVDEDYKFKEPIRAIPFLDPNSPGWSLLIEFYRPDITTNRRLTIGLDTVIMSNIDDILTFPLDVGLLTDPMLEDEVCNGISIVSDQIANKIWDVWTNQREWVLENCRLLPWNTPSELSMMRKLFNADGKVPRIDIGFPGRIFSYKSHIMKDPSLLNNASIIYFHGKPKLQQLYNIKYNIKILENWV
jgi:hypothetical protein